MRPVRVHLDEDAEPPLEAPSEARDVRRAQSRFPVAMQHVDAWVVGAHRLSDLARAVGAGVVDDQHMRLGRGRE